MKIDSVNQVGLYANRPAFGIAGRLYFASDQSKLYYDTGSAWTEIDLMPTSMYGKFLISDTTLGSDSTIDLTSISGEYNDLELETWIRGAVSATGVAFRLTINNDTTDGNYLHSKAYYGNNGGSSQIATAYAADRDIFAGPGNSGASGYFAYANIRIPLYSSTSIYKHVVTKGTDYRNSTNYWGTDSTMLWLSTAAITRLTLSANNANVNLLTGSRARLFGWKAI